MLDGMQSLPLWQEAFGNPTGANLGTLVNAINIAVLVSATFSSQICETFSRKKPITLGTFLILYDTGYLVAAWTTFSTFKMNSCWSWRLLSLLQGVPAILQLVLSIRVPESPRWLVYKDQRDEAMNVLSKHSCGDLLEIEATLEEEKKQKAIQRSEFIHTKGNRKRLIQ
ncbi:hypothetical protein ACHAQC_009458 [Fusarium culmorum]